MFSEKYDYFIYVSSGMYSMTIYDKSVIKAVFNYKNKDSFCYYTGSTKFN